MRRRRGKGRGLFTPGSAGVSPASVTQILGNASRRRLSSSRRFESDLTLLASECILLKSDLILLASECFLLKSDLILLASECILLESDLILLASECILLESDLILLASECLLPR